MALVLKEKSIIANIFHDVKNGIYTFCLVDKGGPIIVSRDEETGKTEFQNAIWTISAIKNLHYFNSKLKVTEKTPRHNSKSKENITYYKHEMA